MISVIEVMNLDERSSNFSISFQNISFNFSNIPYESFQSISHRGTLTMVLSMTVVFTILFITGVVGNTATCIVISRNRYMHTATNYYLFSLAISDILLLVMGLPHEIYHLWIPFPYIFGEPLCVLRGFAAETCTNASILTITAFTVERYVAICHPLRAHTMSRLSRAVKTTVIMWILAAAGAIPLAYQFGIIYVETVTGEIILETATCSVKNPSSFEFTISSVIFFFVPLIVITILYVKIGMRLKQSDFLLHQDAPSGNNRRESCQSNNSRKAIVKMLVAVVVSFFLCWSPYQAQRLMAIYMVEQHSYLTRVIYEVLHNISGVTYYLSATINPILYHLMSLKFQQAFKDTFGTMSRCLKGEQDDQAAENVTEHSRITHSASRRKSQLSQSKTRRTNDEGCGLYVAQTRAPLACIYTASQRKAGLDRRNTSTYIADAIV